MEKLKGKTIFVGKEPGNGRLLVGIAGMSKTIALGSVNSVPSCVSRLMNGIGHCKIEVGYDGKLTVTNMKEQNVTFVNGAQIVSKRIDQFSRVELGKDHYPIDVNMVLHAAEKIVSVAASTGSVKPQPERKSYSIRHLKPIWNNYDQSIVALQIEQQQKGNQQRLTGILSQLGMLCVIIPSVLPQVPIPDFLRVLLVVDAIGMSVYLYFKGKKPEELFIVKKKKLDEDFEHNYVCPNPDCHHFLENRKYSLLLQDGQCRYCKCKFIE